MVRPITRAPRAGRRHPIRPRVESLEGRNLPSFAVPVQTPLPSVVSSAAVGDFNGDGRQDLAAGGDNIRLLLSRGDGTFRFDQTYATGPNSKVLTTDFNNDGKLDLLVTISVGNVGEFAKVLLGTGTGKFYNGGTVAIPVSRAVGLAAGDFDNDGSADVAIATRNADGTTGSVQVFRGRGTGSFFSPDSYDVAAPTALSAGDVNGDGKTDLIALTVGDPNVSVLTGDGEGNFAGPITSSLPMQDAVRPTFGDFNNDGRTDLVYSTTGFGKDFALATGTADGAFVQAGRVFISTQNYAGILAGDFNGDGRTDALPLGQDARLHPGSGSATFGESMQVVLGAFPGVGVVGDFDGDGRPDLAGFSDAGPVSVILNRPAVAFKLDLPSAAVAGNTYRVTVSATTAVGTIDPAYVGTVKFSASDVTAGLPADYQFTPADKGVRTFNVKMGVAGSQTVTVNDKVATAVMGSAQVMVVQAATQPTPVLAAPRFVGVGVTPSQIVFADFNRDGKADMAVANAGYLDRGFGGSVTVSMGNGDGTFRTPIRLNASNNVTAIVAADFNNDGRMDLAAAGSLGLGRGGVLTLFFGTGTSFFRTMPPVLLPATTGSLPYTLFSLATGDFNGDGWADIALAGAGALTTNTGGRVQLFINRLNGTFTAGQPVSALTPVGLVVGDFTGDGKLDVAAASYAKETTADQVTGYKLLVFAGNGNGGLAVPTKYEMGGLVNSVVSGDFNADGRPDLAAISEAVGTGKAWVQVLLGKVDGTFTPPVKYDGGPDPDSLAVADLNTDGKLDLAVVNNSSGKVHVMRGTGTGTFTAAGVFYVGTDPHGLAAGDVNGDGFIDLAVANAGSLTTQGSRVAVLLNGGFSQFTFASVSFSASARAGFATITVTRTGDLSAPANVRYATFNGTAIAGLDFRSAAGVLAFQAGEATKTFNVTLLPAAIGKPARTVRLVLSNPDNGATLVMDPVVGVLTITG